ncbi:MAG: glycosyltransferase [Bergeyella zoohelcum]|nr:glycosyltransferase [Bergeyella zoohelcum]
MTDIFIKSFNRPYYLERCVRSILEKVSGDYRICILDDGTPEKYLTKIKELYPSVEIRTSAQYQDKLKSIAENIAHGTEINGFNIPTDLWKSAVEEASDYFIMTEDDVWFTETINVNDLAEKAQKHRVSLLKLGWLSNHQNDKWLNISTINDELDSTQPKDLFLSNSLVMDWFFYNKFKFFSWGYRLKVFDNQTKQKYWALNSILMGFWQKEYWLYVWKDAYGKLDEKQQLRNAAIYYRKHQENKNFIARLKQEAMKTTFQSSATNSYHEYGFNFDVNLFNHLLNEAWYNGDFDSMQNFPKDFSLGYIEPFISEKISVEEYRKWVEQFRNQYKNLGCEIE